MLDGKDTSEEVSEHEKSEDESEVTKEDVKTDGDSTSNTSADSKPEDDGKAQEAPAKSGQRVIEVQSVKPAAAVTKSAESAAKPFRPKAGPTFLRRLRKPPTDLPSN